MDKPISIIDTKNENFGLLKEDDLKNYFMVSIFLNQPTVRWARSPFRTKDEVNSLISEMLFDDEYEFDRISIYSEYDLNKKHEYCPDTDEEYDKDISERTFLFGDLYERFAKHYLGTQELGKDVL